MLKHLAARVFVLAFAGQLVCLSPTLAADALDQAKALYAAKDYKGASESFYREAQAHPSPTAFYYLALCYEQLHFHPQAVDVFGRICKQWPGTDEAKLATEFLQKVNDTAAAQNESAAAAPQVDTPESRAKALHKPISKAEWAALPAKVRFPIMRELNGLMVTAKINGQYCKLAFDTGANMCSISLYDYPKVLSSDDLKKAMIIPVSRPHGIEPAYVCDADITLNDLTRRVKVLAFREPHVNTIGQNFFREYNYQVDDFYVRLTKAPYTVDASGATAVAEVPASVAGAATAHPSSTASRGATSGTTGATAVNLSTVAASAEPIKKKYDRYTIPYEKVHESMLIDVEINGYKTKAVFDTGCAPDGIVCHPNLIALAHLTHPNSRGNRADRLVIGSIIKMDVPVYYAMGLQYPLIGPKVFNRPFTVDPTEQVIRFDY